MSLTTKFDLHFDKPESIQLDVKFSVCMIHSAHAVKLVLRTHRWCSHFIIRQHSMCLKKHYKQ